MAGKLLGDNFITRLLRILPWAEQQMGRDPLQVPPMPQILGGMAMHFGKLDADLSAGGTATVSIWKGDTLADTGDNIDDVKAPPLLTSGTLSEGEWVLISRIDGYWYVIGAEC